MKIEAADILKAVELGIEISGIIGQANKAFQSAIAKADLTPEQEAAVLEICRQKLDNRPLDALIPPDELAKKVRARE